MNAIGQRHVANTNTSGTAFGNHSADWLWGDDSLRQAASGQNHPGRSRSDGYNLLENQCEPLIGAHPPNGAVTACDLATALYPYEAIAFVYLGWNLIAEYTDRESVLTLHKSYTWGIDLSHSLQGAGGVGGLLAITDHSYPAFDGNSNLMQLYKDVGGDDRVERVARFDYDPFGRMGRQDGSYAPHLRHRFSTKYQDEESGFFNYGYRYYDPQTGRCPSRDPIGERGGVNLYGFSSNLSLNQIDQLGLERNVLNQPLGSLNEDHTFKIGNKVRNDMTKFSTKMEMGEDGCKFIVEVFVDLTGGVTKHLGGDAQGSGLEDPEGYSAMTDAQAIAKLPELQAGIDHAWNDRFVVCCDKLTFTENSTTFTNNSPSSQSRFDRQKYVKHNCCCNVEFQLVDERGATKVGHFTSPETGSNQYDRNATNPGLTLGQTAAHEFGHWLGNIDEYNNASDGTVKGNPNKPCGQPLPTNIDPDSIMLNPKGQAESRHLWRVMQQINGSGSASGCVLKQTKE